MPKSLDAAKGSASADDQPSVGEPWQVGGLLVFHTASNTSSFSLTQRLCAGDDCPFAHGVYEVLLHPLRYRTELCKDFVQRGFCARDVCFFAHFHPEQRTPDEETMVRYNVLQARLYTCSGCTMAVQCLVHSLFATCHP